MRAFALLFSMSVMATPLLAQTAVRKMMYGSTAGPAEAAVKQAMEQFVAVRKFCDRDVEVLAHLRAADKALADPTQPENAVQKAHEELDTAGRVENSLPPPEFVVLQGIAVASREIDGARRSPMTADFGHLRTVLRLQALGPASRVAVRDAARLDEEAKGWLKVQGLIADYLQQVSDAATASLRASEQE